jgi:hypothetical protein
MPDQLRREYHQAMAPGWVHRRNRHRTDGWVPNRICRARAARDICDYMAFREIFLLISAATGGVM